MQSWFTDARYGLFIHYGLYSILGRGEWTMNRERIAPEEYHKLAERFDPSAFDAGHICDLAIEAGMRYVVFTTMHHDGFRLYDTKLSDFNSVKACGRDLVAELVAAARARGLRIGLYHSLNNWMDQPDAVNALEDPAAYQRFITGVHARCVELAERYPLDVFWFDGWFPFDAKGWQAEALCAKIRAIRPDVLFNPRSGLPGDFATPEGHLGAPSPWRPWESCITTNESWGYHAGDHAWKSPADIANLLATAAAGRGNLLLNIGPTGDGSLPAPAVASVRAVGAWLRRCGPTVYAPTRVWSVGLMERGTHQGDWNHHGPMTVTGNTLNVFLRRWPGPVFTTGGFQARVLKAELLGRGAVPFTQDGEYLRVSNLGELPSDDVCPVLSLTCDREPAMYLAGGMRVPRVRHAPYDPCPSELVGTPGGH